MQLIRNFGLTEPIGSSGNASLLYRDVSVSNITQDTDYPDRFLFVIFLNHSKKTMGYILELRQLVIHKSSCPSA
jgi:hypothetical protein